MRYSTDEIQDWIVNWFNQNTDASREVVLEKIDSNYFEQGWIDSLKFMTFLTDLEERFNITFSNEEFQKRDFSTIQGLARLVERLSSLHDPS